MHKVDQHRRKIIKGTVVATISTTPLMVSGCSNKGVVDRKLKFNTLEQGLAEAERLVGRGVATVGSGFTLPQTLVHCAQSIEFSLAGFPRMKSAFFQNTVGSAAFSVFSWRQRMSHDLSEAIPGAQPLSGDISAEAALARLVESAETFKNAQAPLKPHFAYGSLDKNQYLVAHAMHLADHFSAIDA